VNEAEIELVSGDLRRLLELGIALVDELPELRLLFASKAARGWQLTGNAPGEPRHARRLRIRKGSSPGTVAVQAAAEALAQIAGNLAGVVADAGSAFVHQLRIGVRRYRTSLRLAEAALLPLPAQALQDEFRSLWSLLGDTRDWDVLIEEGWPDFKRSDAAGAEATARLEERLVRRRAVAYQALRAAIDAPRFHQAMLAALWAVENQRQVALGQPSGGAKALARSVLAKRWKRVRRDARQLPALDAEQRHALRIAVKKLRYQAEYVEDLFGKSKVRRYLRRLEDLQGALGELNDLEAMSDRLTGMLGELQEGRRAALAEASLAFASDRRARLLGEAGTAWERLADAKPFWK
jgi:CHAD domain-containing protein